MRQEDWPLCPADCLCLAQGHGRPAQCRAVCMLSSRPNCLFYAEIECQKDPHTELSIWRAGKRLYPGQGVPGNWELTVKRTQNGDMDNFWNWRTWEGAQCRLLAHSTQCWPSLEKFSDNEGYKKRRHISYPSLQVDFGIKTLFVISKPWVRFGCRNKVEAFFGCSPPASAATQMWLSHSREGPLRAQ